MSWRCWILTPPSASSLSARPRRHLRPARRRCEAGPRTLPAAMRPARWACGRRGRGWQWVSVCGKSLATLCGGVCGDDATAGLASPQPAATGARAQPYRRSSGLGAAARWPALAKAPAPGRAARPVLAGPCSPGPGCAALTGAADGHPSHGAARRSRRRGCCMKGCADPGQGTSGVAEGRLYQKGVVCVLPMKRCAARAWRFSGRIEAREAGASRALGGRLWAQLAIASSRGQPGALRAESEGRPRHIPAA